MWGRVAAPLCVGAVEANSEVRVQKRDKEDSLSLQLSTMSGLDYSKWDKMASEMSDSDEENGEAGNTPHVTVFDKPQSVSFGGTASSAGTSKGFYNSIGNMARSSSKSSSQCSNDHISPCGASVTLLTDRATSIDSGRKNATARDGDAGTSSADASSLTPKIPQTADDARLTENGMAVKEGDQNAGGRGRLRYVWRQTRSEVIVVVPAPPETRAADVLVSLEPKAETITEGVVDLLRVAVTMPRGLGITSDAVGMQQISRGNEKEVVVLLDGELSFQGKLDGEGNVDWQLKDFPGTVIARAEVLPNDESAPGSAADAGESPVRDCRGIEVTLLKHCPIPGVTLWWRSLLKGGPEIDVTSIQGRPVNKHRTAWEEALGMFKDKMAKRKKQDKIPVDTGEGGHLMG